MGFLKKLVSLFAGGPRPSSEENALYYYVRCHRCKEVIRGRINLANDLSAEYGEGEDTTGYIYHKTLIGRGRCFQALEVTMTFDARRNILSREITGGEFVTEEEYKAASSHPSVSASR